MINIKNAFRILFDNPLLYALKVCLLIVMTIITTSLCIAYDNLDLYITMTGNLSSKNYVYFYSLSSGTNVQELLPEARVYGEVSKNWSNGDRGFVLSCVSNELLETIDYPYIKGGRPSLDKQEVVVTKDSGYNIGDVLDIKVNGVNGQYKVSGVLANNTPLLKMDTGGTDMDLSYLFRLRTELDLPYIILPLSDSAMGPLLAANFEGGTCFVDVGEDKAEASTSFALLSAKGFTSTVAAMTNNSKTLRTATVKLVLPYIISLIVIFLAMLYISALYTIEAGKYTFGILKLMGARKSNMFMISLCIGFIIGFCSAFLSFLCLYALRSFALSLSVFVNIKYCIYCPLIFFFALVIFYTFFMYGSVRKIDILNTEVI